MIRPRLRGLVVAVTAAAAGSDGHGVALRGIADDIRILTRRAEDARPGWTTAPLLVAAILIAAYSAARLISHIRSDLLFTPYRATLYWVDYSAGFVRRGLPGQILATLTGGAPGLGAATAFAVALTAAAGAALAWLGVRLAAQAPEHRTVILFVVCAAPFTLPMLSNDVGRYDAVGVIAAALVATVGVRLRRRPRLTATVVAAAVAVAAASEEFLVAFLAPAVLVVAWRAAKGSPSMTVRLTAVMLGPGAVIAVASIVARPDPLWLRSRAAEAFAAGVAPADRPGHDGASMLGATLPEQLADYYRLGLLSVVVGYVLMGALFALVGYVLWCCVGNVRGSAKLTALTAGWLAAAATVLSLIGIDHIRWFGLAFVGLIAVWVAATGHLRPVERQPSTLLAWTVAAGCLLLVGMPVGPIGG